MTSAILLQVLPDTIVTVPARDVHDVLQTVVYGLALATLLAALLLLGYVALTVHRASRAVSTLRDRIPVEPAVASLRLAASNLQDISSTLRKEALRVSGSATRLAERLDQASDRVEERIEDFNALIEVIQQEAEGAFVESASAARGVKAGIGALRNVERRSAAPSASTTDEDPRDD